MSVLKRNALLLSLGLLAFALFLSGAGGFFVFDSRPHLAGNTYLPAAWHDPHSLVLGIFSFSDSLFQRPLSMFSFALETALIGEVSPAQLKLTNILIHLGNGLLVYAVVMGVGRQLNPVPAAQGGWLALMATAIWVLNPLHVSSVLYAVQRMTLLSATFTLLGMWAYLHWRPRLGEPGAAATLVVALALCTLLATLAKESGLLLLPIVLLLEWLRPFRNRTDRRLGHGALALLVAGTIAGLLAPLLAPEFFARWYQGREFDVWERLLTQARVLWHYVLWFGLPLPSWLGMYHDDIALSRGLLSPWTTLAALAGWLAVLGVALALNRRAPAVAFALLLFPLGHSMESTLVPLEMVFEHRNYLPSIGLAMLLAWALGAAVAYRRRLGLALGAAVLLMQAALLGLRASYWQDEQLLAYTHFRFHPESARSLYHYANVSLRHGEAAEDEQEKKRLLLRAYGLYERLDAQDPHSWVAPVTLLYMDSRYFGGARGERWLGRLRELAGRRVSSASDSNAMGLLAGCRGAGWCERYASQVLQLLRAVQSQYPQHHRYAQLLAEFHLSGGDSDRASHWAQRAIALRPSPEAYYLAAAAAAARGDDGAVLRHMEAVQRLDGWGHYHQRIKRLLSHGSTSG